MKPSKIKGKQFRALSLERAAIDEKARTATAAFSSEEPYARWWGEEILDHGAGSVRLGRLRDGAPVLVGHDTGDQVGVVESVAIGADRRGRATVRFGRSPRAEEIFRDVLDGIRTKMSVGYIIHDLQLEREEEGVQTFRVTDWEPLEVSLVAVPADNTVGVGRGVETKPKGHPMDEEDFQLPAQQSTLNRRERRALARAESSESHAEDGEYQRGVMISKLMAAGRTFAKDGGVEIAQHCIERGQSLDYFRGMVMERISGKQKPLPYGNFGPTTDHPELEPFGAGARELLPMPKHFTGECAQERAYRSGMWFRAYIGQCIPRYRSELAERFVREHGLNRAMGEDVLSAGGALVPQELSPVIIDLANKYGAFRANADSYPMKSDTLSVPRSTSDPTTAFVGENGAITESAGAWDMITLSAKKIGTIIRVSTELVEDSVINVADRLAFQLGRAFSRKEDECGFLGDATSTYGGMEGIFIKLADASHTAGKVTAAANHDTFAEIDATDLANLMAALPEYAHEGAKFYCSQVAWSLVFWRLMAAASGNSVSDVAGNVPKFYAGYPVVTNATLPAGAATDYTALTMLAFGNLRLSSKFGARRDIRIQILSETYAANDQIGVMATERFDINNANCGDNTTAGPIVGLIGA